MARRTEGAVIDVGEVHLSVDGIALSGLLIEADTEPRALVVALHGGGMRAGYFHGGAHPDLSLLTLAHRVGFSALALDRPGYGASQSALPRGMSLVDQAGVVTRLLEAFARTHPVGAGVFLVGHSYGLKLALHMAAQQQGAMLIGIDGSGAVYRYQPALAPVVSDDGVEAAEAADAGETAARPSQRTLFWGSEALYPEGTFAPGTRPIADVPDIESEESASWTDRLPDLALRIRVPYQFSVAEHEKWWQVGDGDLDEYRSLFPQVPTMIIRRQPGAGHNISLGWAARSYHLNALAFAEHCILATRTTDVRG